MKIDVIFEHGSAQQISTRLGQISSSLRHEIAKVLVEEAEEIMAESKQLVPVDTGTLRSSGHVQSPDTDFFGNTVVKLGYGGAAASYALIVHERLDVRHPVGQAKYLEMPAVAAIPRLRAAIAAAVRRATGL